jgi:hypothetical protein
MFSRGGPIEGRTVTTVVTGRGERGLKSHRRYERPTLSFVPTADIEATAAYNCWQHQRREHRREIFR